LALVRRKNGYLAMLIVKQSVLRVVMPCWVALWLAAVGLNGWRLKPLDSPASLTVLALACFIVAGVTLAVLVSDRARRVLAEPRADLARARLPLWGFFGAFASVGAFMLVSALVKVCRQWLA
jgi:hypothetical protein